MNLSSTFCAFQHCTSKSLPALKFFDSVKGHKFFPILITINVWKIAIWISHTLSCKFIAVIDTRWIHYSNIYLDNGAMKTPKRRFISLFFTCLYITKSLLRTIKFKQRIFLIWSFETNINLLLNAVDKQFNFTKRSTKPRKVKGQK